MRYHNFVRYAFIVDILYTLPILIPHYNLHCGLFSGMVG